MNKPFFQLLTSAAVTILLLTSVPARAGYVDHRGHNVDSLETLVAGWTNERIAAASDEELSRLNRDWRELMLGYLQTNRRRSRFFASKALAMGLEKGWNVAVWDAAKVLGQHHWAGERYDSASFYYGIALDAIARMQVGDVDPEHPDGLTRIDIDNGLSAMYGTLGNLYSIQDSTALAMEYYAKAGEIFEAHGWKTSQSCLYSNIGTTWLEAGELKKARSAFVKGLSLAKETGDSLWIAGNNTGLGAAELKLGQLRKAIRHLDEANRYYTAHEDQEGSALIESLGYTNEVLRLQKRQAKTSFCAVLAALILLLSCAGISWRMMKLHRQKIQTDAVLEETIKEITRVPAPERIKLTEREQQILSMIADGSTNKEIAEQIFLSPETVKWYRKKLLVKFDAANSAELVSKASRLN